MKFSEYLNESITDIVILTPDMLGKEFSLQDRKQKYIISNNTVYLKYGSTPTISMYDNKIEWIPSKSTYIIYDFNNKKIGISFDRIDLANPPSEKDIGLGWTNLKKQWKSVIHMKIYNIINQ